MKTSFSEDRVPDHALGLDIMILKLMHWVMASWQHVDFFTLIWLDIWFRGVKWICPPACFVSPTLRCWLTKSLKR